MRLYKIRRMRFLIAGILVLVSTLGFAQSSVLRFTDYGVTRPLINPACMGLEEGVNGLLLYRSRFEKSEYWPSTGAFNINSMIKDKNLGGGLTLIFDKYGPYQKLFAYVAGSYKLKVNEGKYLYFGLQAGLNYVSNSGDYLMDQEEVIFQIIIASRILGSDCIIRPINIMSGFPFLSLSITQLTNRETRLIR